MPELNLYQIYVVPFNNLGLIYMVTGAAASIIYGEPRLTNDIDLVVDLRPHEIDLFSNSFPIESFYCPPIEVIQAEISRSQQGHFNLIHHDTGFKADIYTAGRDELNHWGLKNRKQIQVNDDDLWLASIEYVILRKLQYYREGKSEKHLRDIAGMISVSSDQIQPEVLDQLISRFSLEKEWDAAGDYAIR
jgi:hypothetical protein